MRSREHPIVGTGYNHKTYSRLGCDLFWIMGYPSAPLFFTVAYLYGREEDGLATCAAASGADPCAGANHFSGGFAELDWAPSVNLVVFARALGADHAAPAARPRAVREDLLVQVP